MKLFQSERRSIKQNLCFLMPIFKTLIKCLQQAKSLQLNVLGHIFFAPRAAGCTPLVYKKEEVVALCVTTFAHSDSLFNFLFSFVFSFSCLAEKASEALYLGQAIIPTFLRRCQDIAVRLKFLFLFLVLSRFDWNLNCLPRLLTGESAVKCLSQDLTKLHE